MELSLCASGESRAVLEVIDTGPGLPPGSEDRIFDRFYRAAPADTDGSGLGLAIARRVAERHGLELTVSNREDGATGVVARVVLEGLDRLAEGLPRACSTDDEISGHAPRATSRRPIRQDS